MVKLKLKRPDVSPPEYNAQGISHGILTEWNDERGFGFISPDDGGKRVFLHVSSLKRVARRPVAGELFFYKLATDAHGRPRAEEAFQTILSEKRDIPSEDFITRTLAFFWPLAFVPFLVLTALTGNFVAGLCAAFVVNSLLTILFYREDKYLAQYKYWRIDEKILHIWELLCGWPGALFAQHYYRHKRKKRSFMSTFWFCLAANVIALLLFSLFGEPMAVGKEIGKWWKTVYHLHG